MKNLILGLIRKRSEIAGKIQHHDEELRKLLGDLEALDHVIYLFDPEANLADVKPKPLPPRNQAAKGEVTRFMLETLRESPKPMTSKELTRLFMEARGLNEADRELKRTIMKRTGACLKHLKYRGLVASRQGKGPLLEWRLVG